MSRGRAQRSRAPARVVSFPPVGLRFFRRAVLVRLVPMCRNIRTLHNYDPPTTAEEIRDAALQYVRKVSGYAKPSAVNREAFDRALEDVEAATARLLSQLVRSGAPRTREGEAQKARERWRRREARARG